MRTTRDRSARSPDDFLARHRLPAAFAATAETYFVPLARWVNDTARAQPGRGFVLGINGAQGAGKSTLAAFLANCLGTQFGTSVATLSIDDLYLPKAERRALARTVHPLLATRGVPGTHDVELGCRLIEQLKSLGEGERLALPRFDKLRDDRVPTREWPTVTGPVDVILFEGWCVGSQPVNVEALVEPCNEFERRRDAGGEWRRYVNEQLGARYQALFALIDALVFMAVPDFDCVLRWRTEQEHHSMAAGGDPGMDDAQVAEFVQYFERISRDNLAVLPGRADVVFWLGQDHQVVRADYRQSPAV